MEGFFSYRSKIYFLNAANKAVEKENIMKKLTALTLTLVMLAMSCLVFTSCDEPDDGKFTVGVCQLLQHAALDQATQGFVDALKEELGEENVEIDVKYASGDTNLCNTIVGDFVSKNVDLIMANATPALQAAASATLDIPILGTSITEYGVALGIENFNGVVGGNISGTSDLSPLDKQAEMILAFCPDAEKIGIVFCSAEANSRYQVDEMKKELAKLGIDSANIKEFSFSDSNDIAAVVEAACAWSDAIYIPTDNKAADNAELIGNIVRERKVPVFTGEENPAKACGVASITISYYDIGVATGKMAAKILKGEADISTMTIEYAPKVTPKFNKEMCELLGLTVPEGYVEMDIE